MRLRDYLLKRDLQKSIRDFNTIKIDRGGVGYPRYQLRFGAKVAKGGIEVGQEIQNI